MASVYTDDGKSHEQCLGIIILFALKPASAARRVLSLEKRAPALNLANRHSEIQSTISVTEATRKETIRLLTPIEVLYSIESAIRLMIAGP